MYSHELRASLHACYADIVAGIVYGAREERLSVQEKAALILRQGAVHAEFGLECGEREKARMILEGVQVLLHSFCWDDLFDDLRYADALALKGVLQGEMSALGRVLGGEGGPSMALSVRRLRDNGTIV